MPVMTATLHFVQKKKEINAVSQVQVNEDQQCLISVSWLSVLCALSNLRECKDIEFKSASKAGQ